MLIQARVTRQPRAGGVAWRKGNKVSAWLVVFRLRVSKMPLDPTTASRSCNLVLGMLLFVPLLQLAAAETHESFETPGKSWVVGNFDCPPVRVLVHERQFQDAHSGKGCEVLNFSAGQGTQLYVYHPVPAAPVIHELLPSLWIKADRRGPQLMARVVFPRSQGKDGKPLTAFLSGDSYQDAGLWRQLRLEDLAEKMQREVRVLRSHPGLAVDEREAFIDLLVVNLYAGPGTMSVRLDDLEMTGLATAGEPRPNDPLHAVSLGHADSGIGDSPGEEEIKLQGNILLARGRPLFVRAVAHNGETFAYLQSLGFNTIVLSTPATRQQHFQAERADVWLVAPPHQTNGLVSETGPERSRILAWSSSVGLARPDEQRVSTWVREIRSVDAKRPLLLPVASGWSRFRFEDAITLYERPVIGTSFDLRNYGPWLAHASQHGRRGSPFWAVIPTELPQSLRNQFGYWLPANVSPPSIDLDQMRWMAFESVSRGARGLFFQSHSRLDGTDPAGRVRAASIRLLNHELELVTPWVAGGIAVGEASNSPPRVRACTLQTERARMLIVVRQAADQQFVPAAAPSESSSLVVHATQISDQAYRVAVEDISPITIQRGGGVRVTLDANVPVELILLTQDPLAVNYVGRASAEIRRDYAARQCELLQWVLQETEAIETQLGARGPVRAANSPRPETDLALIRVEWQRATQLSSSGDARTAIQTCNRAFQMLRRIRRSRWELAVLPFPDPLSSPLCATYGTLPIHYQIASRLASTAWSPNLLPAGDMESLEHLLGSGWRQQRSDLPGFTSDVRLSLVSPRSGRSALQIRTWKDESSLRTTDGEWPVTMHSASISVRPGQLLRIHGWVNVPGAISGSWDGLLIYDSQSGPELGERITHTQGWREFTMYRTATAAGDWNLVFALTGTGEAWLDEVSVSASESMPAY